MEYEMVLVPGGSFQMGDTAGGGLIYERPVRMVTLSSFYIGKYTVTQSLYKSVTGNNPSVFKGGNLPVESLTWYDAVEFCNKASEMEGLDPAYSISDRKPKAGYPITSAEVTADWGSKGYRLPTEAEWEYAAKGGDGSPGNYLYAGSNDADTVAWHSGNSKKSTHTVGTKEPNGLGIYDMTGNVWEWCWDWLGSCYLNGAETNPTGASSGSVRAIRGGSCDFSADRVRSAARGSNYPYDRRHLIGFRLVRI